MRKTVAMPTRLDSAESPTTRASLPNSTSGSRIESSMGSTTAEKIDSWSNDSPTLSRGTKERSSLTSVAAYARGSPQSVQNGKTQKPTSLEHYVFSAAVRKTPYQRPYLSCSAARRAFSKAPALSSQPPKEFGFDPRNVPRRLPERRAFDTSFPSHSGEAGFGRNQPTASSYNKLGQRAGPARRQCKEYRTTQVNKTQYNDQELPEIGQARQLNDSFSNYVTQAISGPSPQNSPTLRPHQASSDKYTDQFKLPLM